MFSCHEFGAARAPIRTLTRMALALAVLFPAGSSVVASENDPLATETYRSAIIRFADRVLESGRDHYGEQKTPLFVDGLQVKTLEPALWKGPGGVPWVLSNFASQQSLIRLLDGLTALAGEERYRTAAEDATRYALRHLVAPNGLLYWGGHAAWDLQTERPVGNKGSIATHELKGQQGYYRLMWRVDPAATQRLMEAIWAGHILDWSLLDFNRHAATNKEPPPPWKHAFNDQIEVPFPAQGGNLSFCNVMPTFIHTGVLLSVLGDHDEALTWTRRIIHRWQEARDPKTGLSGGQLSFRELDRAQLALGHVHPKINEAKIVATYHQSSRYHRLPLDQMVAAEAMVAAGGRNAEVGREFIRWASADLLTYSKYCYDRQAGKFRAVMTDGTPIKWQESKVGYYIPASFAPMEPDGLLLRGYALAWRLTRDPGHWTMLRHLFRDMKLGELGNADGTGRALGYATAVNDWEIIYALLELHDPATKDQSILRLAARIADNLLKTQAATGLFPREGRQWARTGDDIPLALLHLVAAIEGKRDRIPPAVTDRQFFHAVYYGELEEYQKKRADERTYDSNVYYGN